MQSIRQTNKEEKPIVQGTLMCKYQTTLMVLVHFNTMDDEKLTIKLQTILIA